MPTKLGRTSEQRNAMLRNQASELLWYGKIETTAAKAKALQSYVEKIITKAMSVYDLNEETTVTVKDSAAYGFILIEGHGKFGKWGIETPTLIRYGELTNDEFFVTEKAAKKGIKITNESKTENIVMLKHFAENPDLNF